MDDLAWELAVEQASKLLSAELFKSFRRFSRELWATQGRWSLFIMQYRHQDDIKQLEQAICQLFSNATILKLDENYADWLAVEQKLFELSKQSSLIHLTGLDDWLDTLSVKEPTIALERSHTWNIRRESLASQLPVALLCWMQSHTIRFFAQAAPDLWAWRTGVHDFSSQVTNNTFTPTTLVPHQQVIDNRTVGQRTKRIREIEAYLQQHSDSKNQILLYDELASLYKMLGQYEQVLMIYQQKMMPIVEQLGDIRAKAITLGKIADVLMDRGDYEEVLRICYQEQLPVYEQLGNVRAKAITLGKIANVLMYQGHYTEVLQVLKQEVLPTFEQLGDIREKAITLGQIADILMVRGEYEEVLRIRYQEQLPIYEQLGDIRAKAITLGKIADVLLYQGHYEEVLRVLKQDVLPIFEQLGDIQAKVVALGRIANVLMEQGNYDEALRIRYQYELPIYQQLGEKRSFLIAQANLAQTYLARQQQGDKLLAQQLLTQALQQAQRLAIPEANIIQKLLIRSQSNQAD